MEKLKPYTLYVKETKGLYNQFLDNVCSGTDDKLRVYNRLLFAFLSVNTSYEVTAKAYQAMKNKYWTDTKETMNELLKHGVHYAGARSGYIAAASSDFIENYEQFLIGEQESWNDYRNRLVDRIKGLALVKVSFFITLVYKDADLCCLDRWILRIFNSRDNVNLIMRRLSTKGRYQRYENELRKQARLIGVSMFQYQWSAWDKIQNKVNDMGVLNQS